MKFLCIECDERMMFDERNVPGDGTFAAAFACPRCGRCIALLANPMETQLVESLGVKIGGRTLNEQPLELVRSTVEGRDDAFEDANGEIESGAGTPTKPQWSAEARERLNRVPNFVRGMVKKIYSEYAAKRGVAEITPAVMDRARSELGLEGL